MIEGKPFYVNLLCIPLADLDVILGMNWLSCFHLLLDCALRTVVFPETGVFEYLDENRVGIALRVGS